MLSKDYIARSGDIELEGADHSLKIHYYYYNHDVIICILALFSCTEKVVIIQLIEYNM